MKQILAMLCVITVLFSLSACSNTDRKLGESNTKSEVSIHSNNDTDLSTSAENNAVTDTVSQAEQPNTEEYDNMFKIDILIGSKTFSALLYDNESARALMEQLPMTLNMSELNGNEKYYYLENSLPTNSDIPSEIKAGDIMLYGNNCLVLFYESFSTSYSYTPLGHIDDTEELVATLGRGNVQVAFQKG